MKYRFIKTGKVYELQFRDHKDNKSGYTRMFRSEKDWFNLDWPQFRSDKLFKKIKEFNIMCLILKRYEFLIYYSK